MDSFCALQAELEGQDNLDRHICLVKLTRNYLCRLWRPLVPSAGREAAPLRYPPTFPAFDSAGLML